MHVALFEIDTPNSLILFLFLFDDNYKKLFQGTRFKKRGNHAAFCIVSKIFMGLIFFDI